MFKFKLAVARCLCSSFHRLANVVGVPACYDDDLGDPDGRVFPHPGGWIYVDGLTFRQRSGLALSVCGDWWSQGHWCWEGHIWSAHREILSIFFGKVDGRDLL
jgi:hypothetical protein